MLPLFTTPLALLGLASLPALAAIYYLRNRPRRQVVSSLFLWVDPRETPDAGLRFERLRTPLLFWLELAALALLTLAAAGPRYRSDTSARPLVVVLDDSFSMLAGAPDSSRQRAADALLGELRRSSRGSVRLVLAGDRPQVLGEGVQTAAEVEHLLASWTCQSSRAEVDAAVAFALELGGDVSTVLILSDHAPDPPPGAGRIRWWAFGRPRPNWAFVNASRTPGPRGDRVLLEIANLSSEPRSTTLRIESGEPPHDLQRSQLSLDANETRRLILEAPGGDDAPAIRAVLDPDDLPFDNAVTLLHPGRKTVTYDNRLTDARLRASVERALNASLAVRAESRPHLVFHQDSADRPDPGDDWGVHVLVEPQADAYTGPFVIDRAHPLMTGLTLTGVVWAGGKSPLPGAPVVMAGNVMLLTDRESPSGKHELHLRLRPDLSTLTESPAWPALIWNLVQWRSEHLPGLDRANVRLGQEAKWTLASPSDRVEVIPPSGEPMTLPVRGRRATVLAERAGVYGLRAGGESVEFSANVAARDESDLTGCATGQWGEEGDPTAPGSEYRDTRWLLVLLALAVLTLHAFVRVKLRSNQ
jgi:hypothetical protein